MRTAPVQRLRSPLSLCQADDIALSQAAASPRSFGACVASATSTTGAWLLAQTWRCGPFAVCYATVLRGFGGLSDALRPRVERQSPVQVGYLEQTAVSGSDRPVWAEVRSQMTTLVAAEAALEAAGQAAEKGALWRFFVACVKAGPAADPSGLPAGDPRAPEMLQLAQDQFDAAGGCACAARFMQT